MSLFWKIAGDSCLLWLAIATLTCAQAPVVQPESGGKAQEQSAKTGKGPEKTTLPFQIQLLETRVRFETNGDSSKEVHTVVKLNDAMGVREFARLTFDYNRSFQQVEIPLVRITHPNGGTSDVLPSAISDAPNPAVEAYPAYQDVRVKSVRILGLQEGDTIEYRVVTTTAKSPLAPDFWIEHNFDGSGEVLREQYELDLPAKRMSEVRFHDANPLVQSDGSVSEKDGRRLYQWSRTYSPGAATNPNTAGKPDISFSTLSWELLSVRLAEAMRPASESIDEPGQGTTREPKVSPEVQEKAASLTRDLKTPNDQLRAIYNFVSTQIATVDLPLGATGFKARNAVDILNSGYADAQDKFVLFAALAAAVHLRATAALTGYCDKSAAANPSEFKQLLVVAHSSEQNFWLDPSLEVAPFGMIPQASRKCALYLEANQSVTNSTGHEWVEVPKRLPFHAFQRVGVKSTIAEDGKLTAKVKYTLRGDNELLLRVAFRKTAKDKWKDVAGLLALSDGFRGVVTNVEASDPLATKDPFTVEYELTQEKFVDWAKKPVRIPALLPQIGLPDTSARTAAGNIELGTPLDVDTQMTLQLPPGTIVQTPAGTSVERDYATYSSKYALNGEVLTASRHIKFLLRDVASDRAVDYDAFERAVQNDQSQYFVLDRGAGIKSAAAQLSPQ